MKRSFRLFACLLVLSLWESGLHAEGRSLEPLLLAQSRFSHELLREEEISPSQEEFSSKGEEEFRSEEEPSVMTNAPPPLPAGTNLSPQEQVALRFVEQSDTALALGDFEQAEEQLESALSIAPLLPYSYYFLGRLAFTRGEHARALTFLQKAALLFERGDLAWRGETASLQGAVYEEGGDYQQARAAYRYCLQLMPSNLRAVSALARLPEEEPFPSAILPQ
jgi:tetratricopeptide (TPR) repeat protein